MAATPNFHTISRICICWINAFIIIQNTKMQRQSGNKRCIICYDPSIISVFHRRNSKTTLHSISQHNQQYTDEFKASGWVLLVFIIIYVMISFTLKPGTNIRVVARNVQNCAICYAFGLFPTCWVILQYKKELKHKGNIGGTGAEFMSLEEMLATKDGFEIFANHLVNEFSTENLFFVLEVMQIKSQMLQNKFCFCIQTFCALNIIYRIPHLPQIGTGTWGWNTDSDLFGHIG